MAAALRVTMVTTSYPRHRGDFAGHFVESLARTLVARGHSVRVIAPHDPGSHTREMLDGVDITRVRYAPEGLERLAYGDGVIPNLKRRPWVAAALPGLARAMRRELRRAAPESDIVHVHWAPTALLVGASRVPVPTVVTLHGSDTTLASSSGLWRAVLARAVAGAGGLAVVAERQRAVVERVGGFRGPLAVIPGPVDRELGTRTRPPRGADAPTRLVFVGRLVESKGVRELVTAFTGLHERVGGAELVFVGKGALREQLEAACRHAPVRFEGEVGHERALELLSSADLFVLPSYGEGSPLAATEALALGVPVIATDVGAVPELVGEAGIIVEPRDARALERAIEDALGRLPELTAAAMIARSRIAEEYSFESVAARTEALYLDALEYARGRAR